MYYIYEKELIWQDGREVNGSHTNLHLGPIWTKQQLNNSEREALHLQTDRRISFSTT